MDIFNNSSKAHSCAVRRYYKQKSNDPVYVYRTTVARREMFVVLSTAEITANKISAKTAWWVIDGQHGLDELKQKYQERMAEDPELLLQIKAMRGMRQYYRAKEKLEKMERGADAPERPTELDTSKA